MQSRPIKKSDGSGATVADLKPGEVVEIQLTPTGATIGLTVSDAVHIVDRPSFDKFESMVRFILDLGEKAHADRDFDALANCREQLATITHHRKAWYDRTHGYGPDSASPLCDVCSLNVEGVDGCYAGGKHNVLGDPFIDTDCTDFDLSEPDEQEPCPVEACWGIADCDGCGGAGYVAADSLTSSPRT